MVGFIFHNHLRFIPGVIPARTPAPIRVRQMSVGRWTTPRWLKLPPGITSFIPYTSQRCGTDFPPSVGVLSVGDRPSGWQTIPAQFPPVPPNRFPRRISCFFIFILLHQQQDRRRVHIGLDAPADSRQNPSEERGGCVVVKTAYNDLVTHSQVPPNLRPFPPV